MRRQQLFVKTQKEMNKLTEENNIKKEKRAAKICQGFWLDSTLFLKTTMTGTDKPTATSKATNTKAMT